MLSVPTSARSSDRSLVTAARSGDREAIESLVTTYWPDAYRVAYLLLQDPHSAEDVAQDALLRAVRGLDGFDVSRPLRPWICRIAANRAHDVLRKAARDVPVSEEADVALAAGDDDLADEIARMALSSDLERALAALAPEARTAVVLRHLLDYSPEEIAEIVSVPAGTVRSRIHRGLLAMRMALTEGEDR
jgi:RNA polymerase sigma-70 factor (ECF subfamily)